MLMATRPWSTPGLHGVDLQVSGQPGRLNLPVHVAPGAADGRILVSYSGVEAQPIAADGSLHAQTAAGELVDGAPQINQVIDGQKVDVSGSSCWWARPAMAMRSPAPMTRPRRLSSTPGPTEAVSLAGAVKTRASLSPWTRQAMPW